MKRTILIAVLSLILISCFSITPQADEKIVHDAEYYILEAQNGEKWTADDKKIDQKLAELRKKNGGQTT